MMLLCNTAWCVQDLSSPRCGHCDQGPKRMVEPEAQLVAVVMVPEAQLVVVVLAELEEVQVALVVLALVQLEVALGFARGFDHSCRHDVVLWSQ